MNRAASILSHTLSCKLAAGQGSLVHPLEVVMQLAVAAMSSFLPALDRVHHDGNMLAPDWEPHGTWHALGVRKFAED